MAALLVAAVTPACRTRKQRERHGSPAATHRALVAAARAQNASRVFRLLDRDSQWAVMSCRRDKRAIHALVSRKYPASHKAAELRRTARAMRSADAASLFAAVARESGLWARLAKAGEAIAANKRLGPRRLQLHTRAGVKLVYCREQQGWAFCGAREKLHALKVRAARDLRSVRDNVRMFRRRGL